MNNDYPTKNKKRATRRKRNLVAKELRQNKLYSPKVIEAKRTRKKLRIQDIEDTQED